MMGNNGVPESSRDTTMNSEGKQDLQHEFHRSPGSRPWLCGDWTLRRVCGGGALKRSFANPASQTHTTDTLMALKAMKAEHIQHQKPSEMLHL